MAKAKSSYDYENYIHFRIIDDVDDVDAKNEISYEDIRKYSLDSIGRQAPNPFNEQDFTIMPNYLLKYWSPIIGSDAVSLLMYLKMYAYGKDYTYMKLTRICKVMNKSPKTVRKYLDILEEFGFIAIFRRLNKKNRKRETSPYIKMRLTTPLLTSEQVLLLPEFLREEHEEYLEEYNTIVSTFDQVDTLSNRELLEDIVANGSPLHTFERQIRNILESENIMEFISKTSDIDKATNEKIHNVLEKEVSTPSYRMWFESSMFYIENDALKIVTKSNYERDWIQEKYIEHLKVWLNKHLEFDTISIISFEEIVRAKMKKRK